MTEEKHTKNKCEFWLPSLNGPIPRCHNVNFILEPSMDAGGWRQASEQATGAAHCKLNHGRSCRHFIIFLSVSYLMHDTHTLLTKC